MGVNIDLVDALTNALIASDAFNGVLGGFASSTFRADIGPGSYRLVASGTGVRDSLLDVSLSFDGDASVVPQSSSGALPLQGASVVAPTAFLTALTDSRVITEALGAGDSLIVDSLVTSAVGPLMQSVSFTLDSGVDGLSASVLWEIDTAAGAGPRLIGFNGDLFDANTNTLVYSDVFLGTLGGYAHSAFDGAIGPGAYRLVLSGTAVRDASLNFILSFTGTPVSVGVSAPSEGGLFIAALTLLALMRRARTNAAKQR